MVKLYLNEICTHCLYFIDLLFTSQLISICIPLLSELLHPVASLPFSFYLTHLTLLKILSLEILSTSYCLRLFFRL